MTACTPPNAAQIVSSLRTIVQSSGAHSLPGCSIKFDNFLPVLRRAQSRGYVKDVETDYVVDGLINGFTLGVDINAMRKEAWY